jgi:hypothetical protein
MISDKNKDSAFESWYKEYFDGFTARRGKNGHYNVCGDFIEIDEVFFAGFKACQELMQKRTEELEKQNEIMKEALEFYGDSLNYSLKIDYKGLHYVAKIGEKHELGEDNGKRAREALKQIEENK